MLHFNGVSAQVISFNVNQNVNVFQSFFVMEFLPTKGFCDYLNLSNIIWLQCTLYMRYNTGFVIPSGYTAVSPHIKGKNLITEQINGDKIPQIIELLEDVAF